MRTPVSGLGAFLISLALAAPAGAQALPTPPVAPTAGYQYEGDPGYGAAYNQEYAAPQQQVWNYFGSHPLPYDQGGGFCSHNGAHQHPYPAFDQHLFRESGGYYYFVGDPADFGYQAGYLYEGNHPIGGTYGGGYCYIGWGHRHLFAPAGVNFVVRGGYYAYVGGWGPDYWARRPFYLNYYNGYYRNNYYGGRYFQLRPAHVYGFGYGHGRPYYAPRVYAPHAYAPRAYAPHAYAPQARAGWGFRHR